MGIDELRKEIDTIDDGIIKLIEQRMDVSAEIAKYKGERGLPVLVPERERQKLCDIAEKSRPETAEYMRVLYSLIFELSRSYQTRLLGKTTPLSDEINNAIENTQKLFPPAAAVACQGVEGANSQKACEAMFKSPSIMYVSSFEGIFAAVNSGLCRYGVIPIENSTAGSVKKVYDLMITNNFNIVRSVRIKIDHALLVKKGTKLEDIKEIYSHEQAIGQCENFLSGLKGIKVTACENTASAAKAVAESDRSDVAAIASSDCAALYGLECLKKNIQDEGNNHTRFICISKNLEIYPGADRTSLMLVIPHRPGSLYKVLSRFYALGIDLIKLESRPLPDTDFEFMFYFDLRTSVYSDEFVKLISELDGICDEFKYLGSYSELVI